MCTLSTPTPDPATASVAAFWLWLMMMFLTFGQETKARGENGKWRYLREEAGQRESCGGNLPRQVLLATRCTSCLVA